MSHEIEKFEIEQTCDKKLVEEEHTVDRIMRPYNVEDHLTVSWCDS